jgi:proline dehydrogenase
MSLFDTAVARTLPLVPRPIVGRVASRYVAGERLEDALRTVEMLNREGAMATLDVLGEDITRAEETRNVADEYVRALDAIAEKRLDANVSVKLTALGLKMDRELARRNLFRVLEAASGRGNFVRIDMEDSSVTEATIALFLDARKDHPNVGLALQAYLRRTLADVARMIEIEANLRICKGIYVEPAEIAYRDRELIRKNFAYIVDTLLAHGNYVGIATHDEAMVLAALHSIDRHGRKPGQYEFQMLLGVAQPLRRHLVASGHRLRVYVPYGRAWYAYSLRRLKENPAISRHILRGLLRGQDRFEK